MLREPSRWRRIRKLIDNLELELAQRLVIGELTKAEEKDDHILASHCHACLGDLAEMQSRIGDAFRHWSSALAIKIRLGCGNHAEAERLRRLIRRWHEVPRVWVSYSHADDKRVEAVLNVLRRKRIEIMYDKKFLGGHQIQRQILSGISQCPKHVVFWSANSRKSPWVRYEREILDTLKYRMREDTAQHALDNTITLYCFGKPPSDSEINDNLLIVEIQVGFKIATEQLIRSITTSEVLARI